MKRILSLVLVLALVLGMVPAMSFAAATAGETLKEMGLLKGDAEGNLNEENELTRAEMMVVLARMNKVEDEAKSYEIPSAFADAEGHWAANYIAYAAKEGWTTGTSATEFSPNGKVTVQQAATFMLRVLKYDDKAGDFAYATAVEKATEVGVLANVEAEGVSNILRGDLFTAMIDSLELVSNGGTVKLGVELGVVAATTADIDMKEATAKSYIVVELELNEDVDAVTATDFAIEDENGNVLEVVSADKVEGKLVWLGTEAQTAGKLYTITAGENTVNFTAISKDNLKPEVEAGAVKDNITVEVTFTKEMDRRNALDAANYSINKDLEVVAVEFATDADDELDFEAVILTTSAQKTGTLYELTVGPNATDYAGNSVETEDDANMVKFGGLSADTTAPEIQNVQAVNAEKIVLYFDEDSDLTAATAEDVANYTITNKSTASNVIVVESAELTKDGENKTKVTLMTTAQTLGDTYEVKVVNVADKFGNVIKTTGNTKSFIGQPIDKSAPEVNLAEGKTNTTAEVRFNEVLDEATAEDVANYSINNDLTVVKAELVEDADDEKTIVELTTTSHKKNTVYKITVSNVQDEFGNKVGSDDTAYFSGVALQEDNPTLESAIAKIVDEKTYVYVTFSDTMDEDSAETASNYYFGSEIGYGITADAVNGSTVEFKVRVNELDDSERYTVVVSNITDASGNLVDSDEDSKTFAGVSVADTEAPEVVAAVTLDNQTVKVLFNIKMDETTAKAVANYALFDKADTANKIAFNSAVFGDDEKSVVFTLASEDALVSGHTYDLYVDALGYSDEEQTDYVFDAEAGLVVKASNGVEMEEDDAKTLVGGTSSVKDGIEISSVFATSSETITVSFSKDLKEEDLTAGKFTFVNKTEATRTVTASKAILDPNDDSVVLLRVNNIEKADKLELTVAADAVTEKYSSDTNAADTSDTFYLTTSSVTEPAVAEATVVEDGMIKVVYTKDMDETTATNKGLYEIADTTVSLVEFETDSSNVVFVYFDNTELTPGTVNTLVINNAVVDLLGFVADEDFEIDFATSSDSEADAASILEVRTTLAADKKTVAVKVFFDAEVKLTPNFAVAGADAVAAYTTDGDAYEAGEYVEVIEFTATASEAGTFAAGSHAITADVTLTTKNAIITVIDETVGSFTIAAE